jgi:hypothetical protein
VAIAQCFEVLVIVLLLIAHLPVYIEIAYVIAPFTSQTAIIVTMMCHASHVVPGQRRSRPRAPGQTWVGLAIIIISIIVAVLSTTRVYQSLALIHIFLYAQFPVVVLLEYVKQNLPSTDTRLETPLAALPNSTSSLTHGTSRPTSSGTHPAPHYSPC